MMFCRNTINIFVVWCVILSRYRFIVLLRAWSDKGYEIRIFTIGETINDTKNICIFSLIQECSEGVNFIVTN